MRVLSFARLSRTRKLVVTGAALLAVVSGGLVANASSASAANYISNDHSSCHGQLRRSVPVKNAVLQVYWEASSGTNCAMMVHTGGAYGDSRYTTVSITRHGSSAASTATNTNRGNFRYYAGGVRVYAKGACISAEGTMSGSTARVNRTLCG